MRPRLASLAAALLLASCGGKTESFHLTFAAVADGRVLGCTDRVGDFGSDGGASFGINDLRFYVSNLKFFASDGRQVAHTLDENPFQLTAPAGQVALIDLTGTDAGTCTADAMGGFEGTARTNFAVTGKTRVQDVFRVTFDLGVPQPLMQATIKNYSQEAAPSPLDEMYWNWNLGYRHFVFNFPVTDSAGTRGDGHVHIGSRNCSAAPTPALSDRDSCDYVNTPQVSVDNLDLARDQITVDLRRLLTGMFFVAPIYDPNTFAVVGQGPGVACHSSPTQPDCVIAFPHLGLDIGSGRASATANEIFGRR